MRHLDHAIDDLAPLDLTLLLDLETEFDVLSGGHVREQAVVLEHHPESPSLRWIGSDVTTFDEDSSAIRLLESCEDAQRCRLAAPARPEQADELTGIDAQRELVQGNG